MTNPRLPVVPVPTPLAVPTLLLLHSASLWHAPCVSAVPSYHPLIMGILTGVVPPPAAIHPHSPVVPIPTPLAVPTLLLPHSASLWHAPYTSAVPSYSPLTAGTHRRRPITGGNTPRFCQWCPFPLHWPCRPYCCHTQHPYGTPPIRQRSPATQHPYGTPPVYQRSPATIR
jgi:hypothetical protein